MNIQTSPGRATDSPFAPLAADQTLAKGVLAGQRRPLAKAITLIESQREDHQARARRLLETLLPHTGG
ncbi:MAG: hypothetical protein LBF50_04320, partial [Azoarcus sp.]|nr:hypothetical protein [Azoarcus sp.]